VALYAETMIAAERGEQLAVVDAIADRTYVVSIYANAAARTASSPSDRLELRGTPNAADILSVLPAGFIAADGLPAAASVPPSITARQIRLWLVTHGHTLAEVEAAIDAIPDPAQRELVRVEWEYAPYVERSHPMLVPLASSLGLSAAEVDAAFRTAELL
jgi:hypothetical protein